MIILLLVTRLIRVVSMLEGNVNRSLLISQLDELIARFGEDSTKHKNQHRRLRYAVFALTAGSTLLAGVALQAPGASSEIALAILALSAASGLVTSIEGVRKPAELWVHERATFLALKDLRREVEFSTNDASSFETLETYFQRMQSLLGDSARKWQDDIARMKQANAPRQGATP